MPWLSWHACELVNYRLKPAITFLHCVFLCLSATTLSGSSGRMGSISVQPRTMRSCSADGCQECPPSAVTTTRPYFRTALARSVYSKILVDEEFKNFDRTKVNLLHFLTQLSSIQLPLLQGDESFAASSTLMRKRLRLSLMRGTGFDNES